MLTLSNNQLSVLISEIGAEVQSIKSVETGHEYLWNGDARWWSGHSPILFPIVGGMWNGTCRIHGTEWQIPKHGFVRRAPWHVDEQTNTQVRLSFHSTVGTFQHFPFAYCLTVTYTLHEKTLSATFHVHNLSNCDLHFQLGGHPAIALPDWKEENPVDGYLKLEGSASYVVRVGEQGCWQPEHHAVPQTADGLVPITVDTFSHEALIFPEHQVKAAIVLNLQKQPIARVACESPVWLFWQPQGVHTPFICCEPWYGLCDEQGFEGDISQRPYINCAHAGDTWTGGYEVEIF